MNSSPLSRRLTALASGVALTLGAFTIAPSASAEDASPQEATCVPIPGLPCLPDLPLPDLPLPDLPVPDLPLPDLPLPDVPGLPDLPGFPDTTPPDTTITSGPAEGATITNPSPSFEFVGTENDVESFECNLDGSVYIACASPTTLQNLTAGEHTFTVRAKDQAGNTDPSPASRTFTVDPAATPTYSPECLAAVQAFTEAKDEADKRAKQVKVAKAKLRKAKKAKKAEPTVKNKRKVVRLKKRLRQKKRNLKAAEAKRQAAFDNAVAVCKL